MAEEVWRDIADSVGRKAPGEEIEVKETTGIYRRSKTMDWTTRGDEEDGGGSMERPCGPSSVEEGIEGGRYGETIWPTLSRGRRDIADSVGGKAPGEEIEVKETTGIYRRSKKWTGRHKEMKRMAEEVWRDIADSVGRKAPGEEIEVKETTGIYRRSKKWTGRHKEMKRMAEEEWREVVLSDESRFCLQHHDGRICVWHHRGEDTLSACIRHCHTGPWSDIMDIIHTSNHRGTPVLAAKITWEDGMKNEVPLEWGLAKKVPRMTVGRHSLMSAEENTQCDYISVTE
ncbi:hypothetical protein LAZ67_1001933, partial [Cordylochernes scorpioides]